MRASVGRGFPAFCVRGSLTRSRPRPLPEALADFLHPVAETGPVALDGARPSIGPGKNGGRPGWRDRLCLPAACLRAFSWPSRRDLAGGILGRLHRLADCKEGRAPALWRKAVRAVEALPAGRPPFAVQPRLHIRTPAAGLPPSPRHPPAPRSTIHDLRPTNDSLPPAHNGAGLRTPGHGAIVLPPSRNGTRPRGRRT